MGEIDLAYGGAELLHSLEGRAHRGHYIRVSVLK